ncbi:MAG: hypothetical protein ACRCYO_01785 [Bacteroidia bacterium]
MKQLFFAFAFIAFAHTSNAQSDSSKIQLGISGSADYCGRFISTTNKDNSLTFIYDYLKANEIPAIGYSAGLSASIPISFAGRYRENKNNTIDISILYAERVYKTKKLIFTDMAGTQIGDGYFSYANKFISMPIGIHTKVHNIGKSGKTSFWLGGSLIPEYFIGLWSRGHYNLPDTFDIDDNSSQDKTTEFRSFQMAASLDLGFRKNIGKFRLELNPNAKIALFKQAKNTTINRRLWSAGLEFRLLYSI